MGLEKHLIDCPELKKILKDDPRSIFLLDVREPEEYEESRIEGCHLIPLGELMRRAPSELDPEKDIVVYCAHGVRSLHAVVGLLSLGFEKVRSLEGGICAFEENG